MDRSNLKNTRRHKGSCAEKGRMDVSGKENEIYFMCYNNERAKRPRDAWNRCMVYVQDSIVGSEYSHMTLVIDKRDDQKMVCYDVVCGDTVRKVHKKAEGYFSKIAVYISNEKYNKLMEFMDSHTQRTKFNVQSFMWNFLPFTRFFPTKGKGKYCIQLLAEACVDAGIITLKGKISTDGYINDFCYWWLLIPFAMTSVVTVVMFVILILSRIHLLFFIIPFILSCMLFSLIFVSHACFCFCPWNNLKEPKVINIPPPYRMTVKILWDLIIKCNKSNFAYLSENKNMNDYKNPSGNVN